jgi:hypothetical protein
MSRSMRLQLRVMRLMTSRSSAKRPLGAVMLRRSIAAPMATVPRGLRRSCDTTASTSSRDCDAAVAARSRAPFSSATTAMRANFPSSAEPASGSREHPALQHHPPHPLPLRVAQRLHDVVGPPPGQGCRRRRRWPPG